MKNYWLACTMFIAMGISSCVDSDKDLYQGEPEKEINTSNFSTTSTVNVAIDYAITNAKVPFLIYDKNPLDIADESPTMTMDKSIKPLDGGWTDENGKFTGEINLPAYVSDVYIVSEAFYAPALLKGRIENGTLKVIAASEETEETRAVTRKTSSSYDPNRFSKLGWSTKLGSFDSRTGMIKYAYDGKGEENKNLTLTQKEMTSLRSTVYSVLNTMGSCPKEFRTNKDLRTTDNKTAIVLTSIGGWTCWNSSLGYYYYKENEVPASLDNVKVFTVFPNTQTSWGQSNMSSYPRGVDEGTAVKLKYFGDNGEKTVGEDFPKGYRIGFVLACNSWNFHFTGYGTHTETSKYLSCSTQGLSQPKNQRINTHTAMFKDANGNVAIAFEDFKDDENFTDVIFALKATPEITDVPPVVDTDLNTTIEKTGVYAFEDEWPAAKDYDMNDVVAQYTYQKTFDVNNKILKESFTFKTFANWALYNNGLGVILNSTGMPTPADSIKYSGDKKFALTKFTHEEGNVVILTKNVKEKMNAEYKVAFDYGKESQKAKETSVNPFIFRESGNNLRREIHCPLQRPTNKVDMSFFGTMDDCSVPEKGVYYISDSENIYPFAFYLDNATVEDIVPLLDRSNEQKAISELYPDFINWAKLGKNPDWYKKK